MLYIFSVWSQFILLILLIIITRIHRSAIFSHILTGRDRQRLHILSCYWAPKPLTLTLWFFKTCRAYSNTGRDARRRLCGRLIVRGTAHPLMVCRQRGSNPLFPITSPTQYQLYKGRVKTYSFERWHKWSFSHRTQKYLALIMWVMTRPPDKETDMVNY